MSLDKVILTDQDVLDEAFGWLEAGSGVAIATVVSTWGSSPRPVGSHLCVRGDGAMAGSVSGGCVEGAVVNEALEILKSKDAQVFNYGVTDEMAWEVGLACGGEIRVLVRPLEGVAGLYRTVRERLRAGEASAVVTGLSDGASALVLDGKAEGPLEVPPAVMEEADGALRDHESRLVEADGDAFFVEVVSPPKRLVVVGAVHIAQALVPLAQTAGFQVVVVDPRRAFATDDRFPGVRVVTEWPAAALDALALDDRTAVVTLTHDPKLDDPALEAALQSPVFYVGALGSQKTQEKRAERLKALGLGDAQVKRIHGPVGLDIGAVSPAEIAVSILAQIIDEMRRG